MKRLTTDKPSNNTETMLNYAYAKEGEVRLRYANGKEGIRLTEYLSCLAQEIGCESATEEDILHGDVCSGCDCEVAILNVLAIQAAELRERLKKYEDAEEQELLMNLPCKMTDEVYTLHDGKVCTRRILVMGFDWAEGFCILTEDGYRYPKRLFNKILFFSHEAAEKALEEA